ncbi:MAG: rhomboid family intramembrane serine protease [Myxococcota bacterium]
MVTAARYSDVATMRGRVLGIALCIVFVVATRWLDDRFALGLYRLGIRPRALDGLPGIFLSPLLHVDWAHLGANLCVLAPLALLTSAHSPVAFWRFSGGVVVTAGAMVWLFGRAHSLHLGSSTLIYAYLGHLLAQGIADPRALSARIALLVLLAFAPLLPPLWPGSVGVSWECHLAGLLVGLSSGVWSATGARERWRRALFRVHRRQVLPTCGTLSGQRREGGVQCGGVEAVS